LRIKILGLVALAALVAVLGTLGLSQKPGARADALPIPAVTSGTVTCPSGVTTTICIANGTAVTVSGLFDEDDSCPAWPVPPGGCQASVMVSPAANVTSLVLAATGGCTIDSNGNSSLADETPGNCAVAVTDADAGPATFVVATATTAALDANTVNNIWRLNLTLTATCLVNTTLTIQYTQDAGTQQANVTCVGSTNGTGVIAISKIDQNGAFRAALFGLGQPGFAQAEWTMLTNISGTDNPCLSNDAIPSCATNPNLSGTNYTTGIVNQNGLLPPSGAGGFNVPVGRTIEVREISAPSTCTLVEIKLGPSTSTTVMPLSFPVTFSWDGATFTVNSNGVFFGSVPGARLDLTYVNSCAIPGGATTAGSALAIVLGGASQGLTNSTHIELIPAPGSDNDARIDVRVRDANNIPLTGAHVVIMTDKGLLAMRADTTGTASPNPTGYDVIEPSNPNFGSPYSGDTCDQGSFYGSSNIFNGTPTSPFFYSTTVTGTNGRVQDGYTNLDGIVSACLYVDPTLPFNDGITPGKANITAIIENTQVSTAYNAGLGFYAPQNLVLTGTVTVVGPPASVRVAASPTSLQCGEKATITATVTDSVGQNVSDHTRVELVSNYGSTIGGTGATLGFPGVGPTNPLSSSAAETFSGVATAFLLTSTEHVGPYEVVVATGGSTGGYLQNASILSFLGQYGANNASNVNGGTSGNFSATDAILAALRDNQPGVFGQVGNFSTAPVSAQVTVTCSLPVAAAPAAPVIPIPPIAAPRTGEGIRPPNTGDAGLADHSGNSMALVLAGVAAFVLAGVATVKFARR
jgi:hypothetical protein